jgi:hypothetical protein
MMTSSIDPVVMRCPATLITSSVRDITWLKQHALDEDRSLKSSSAATYVDEAFLVDVSGIASVVVAREPLEILGVEVFRIVVQCGQSACARK